MAHLAQSLNLPPCFVEIRHAATHQELPSLAILRDMSQRALEWLRDNFWALITPDGRSIGEGEDRIYTEFDGRNRKRPRRDAPWSTVEGAAMIIEKEMEAWKDEVRSHLDRYSSHAEGMRQSRREKRTGKKGSSMNVDDTSAESTLQLMDQRDAHDIISLLVAGEGGYLLSPERRYVRLPWTDTGSF